LSGVDQLTNLGQDKGIEMMAEASLLYDEYLIGRSERRIIEDKWDGTAFRLTYRDIALTTFD
jgi:hypothetical protein